MRKGFTLIELLAVIVILAVILVIAVPQILDVIQQAKIGSYNDQVELMKNAAQMYIAKNMETITNPNDVTLSLQTLIDQNLIKSNIKNPIDKQPFDTGFTLRVTRVNNKVSYEAYEGPELVTGMIPVYYDDINLVWKKADKANSSNGWYDYNNYKWANAVTVTSGTRASYNSAAVGTTINAADINAMFVYIPRYRYRIPSGAGAREILIEFETKYTPKSTGDAINTYYTHPAFTFGSTELNGLWVGKFETTGTSTAPTIIPDTTSLRGMTVKTMYDSIKTYMQGSSTFGFNTDSDAHMMKNTEWGAVAYLSGSKYGKYGNPSYTGANKEIYLNNSSNYYTGRSMGIYGGNGITTTLYDGTNLREYAPMGYYTYDGKCATIHANLPAPCNSGSTGQNLTNKNLAYGASTTGTIYGIYDMSGGAWEYVMGMYKPTTLSGITDLSGYSSSTTNSQYDLLTINNKYYNSYLTNVVATGAILGDATKETSGWYSDYNSFINSSNPWFIRGGMRVDGTGGGIFQFSYNNGTSNPSSTIRITLSPNL